MKAFISIFALIGVLLLSPAAFAHDQLNDDGSDRAHEHIADDQAKADACSALYDKSTQSSQYQACLNDGNNQSFVSDIVQTVTNVLTIIIGGAAVIVIVIGGIRFVVSGGDPQAVQGARNSILYAIVGVVVAVFANLIVRFIISEL